MCVLQRFLGMINFYQRFIPHTVQTQAILHKNLTGMKKKDKIVHKYIEEIEGAFEQYKNRIVNAVMLAYPSQSAKLVVRTDTLDSCIGVVVKQIVDGNSQPLEFYSKKSSETQKKYSIYDRNSWLYSHQKFDSCWKANLFAFTLTTNF